MSEESKDSIMTFYVDNKLENKKDYSHKKLIEIFRGSKAYDNYLHCQPFERCFLNAIPGTPEPVIISSENWKALQEELNKQVPNPDFKC